MNSCDVNVGLKSKGFYKIEKLIKWINMFSEINSITNSHDDVLEHLIGILGGNFFGFNWMGSKIVLGDSCF